MFRTEWGVEQRMNMEVDEEQSLITEQQQLQSPSTACEEVKQSPISV